MSADTPLASAVMWAPLVQRVAGRRWALEPAHARSTKKASHAAFVADVSEAGPPFPVDFRIVKVRITEVRSAGYRPSRRT